MGVFAPLSLLPTSTVCACVAEEKKRWDVVIVTVSRYSGGEWPSGEMWCLCRVSLALCDEAESGSWSHGYVYISSETPEESEWTYYSNSPSSLSRKTARPMFIHYVSVRSPTNSFGGWLAALIFQTPR